MGGRGHVRYCRVLSIFMIFFLPEQLAPTKRWGLLARCFRLFPPPLCCLSCCVFSFPLRWRARSTQRQIAQEPTERGAIRKISAPMENLFKTKRQTSPR